MNSYVSRRSTYEFTCIRSIHEFICIGLDTTETGCYEVSDWLGVGVGTVQDGGSMPPSLWAATHTAMSPLIFALTLGYIQVPRC